MIPALNAYHLPAEVGHAIIIQRRPIMCPYKFAVEKHGNDGRHWNHGGRNSVGSSRDPWRKYTKAVGLFPRIQLNLIKCYRNAKVILCDNAFCVSTLIT